MRKENSIMKFKLIVSTLGIIVLLVGAYIGVISMSSSAYASQSSGPIGMPHLSQAKPLAVGMPAITIRNTAKNGVPNAPRISQVDVRNYVQTHPFLGGSDVAGTPSKVTAIDYITSKEASQRLNNDSIGLADTAMVYYVEWQGSFHTNVSAPPGVALSNLKPVSKGVEIFDAQTGNLLLWWVPTN